jgi:hypothetical protein
MPPYIVIDCNHISTALTALRPGLPGRVLRWLAPRLDASFSHGEII